MSREYVQNYDEQERLIRSNIESAKTEGLAEGMTLGHAEGLSQGKHASRLEIARKMLEDDEPLEKISTYTELPLKEITKLKQKILKKL